LFRSTFAYTNITHLIAGRIVAKALDAADWPTLARREILALLGMGDTRPAYRRHDRHGARSCGWPPLDRDRYCCDPVRPVLPISARPRRRHQSTSAA
jgi:CubicO group peptidase (beta-lactamase class C family)